MIEEGRLGFKSGRGFQDWSETRQAELRRQLVDHLLNARPA
jgi:3-hydroxyacyl-CoA dehydrogenase